MGADGRLGARARREGAGALLAKATVLIRTDLAGADGDPRFIAASAVVIGIVMSAGILALTGYYTGTEYRPVKDVGKTSLTGPATVILSGLSVGFESAVYTPLVIGAAVFCASSSFSAATCFSNSATLAAAAAAPAVAEAWARPSSWSRASTAAGSYPPLRTVGRAPEAGAPPLARLLSKMDRPWSLMARRFLV